MKNLLRSALSGLTLLGLTVSTASAGYVLEFQTAPGFEVLFIPDFHDFFDFDRWDLEGDGVAEIVVAHAGDDFLVIYDGTSNAIKWAFDRSTLVPRDQFRGFYDVDGDGVREALFASSDSLGLVLIDVGTSTVEFSLPPGYTLKAVYNTDSDNSQELLVEVSNRVELWGNGPPVTAVEPALDQRRHFMLANTPNPFATLTEIAYTLHDGGRVDLSIYDVAGRMVRGLVDSQQGAGRHVIQWDGRDAGGRRVASGTYFCRIRQSGRQLSEKVLVLR